MTATVQKLITQFLQQSGAEMPPQRIMEYAVQLVEGSDLHNVPDVTSYIQGMMEFIAMMSVTGEFSGERRAPEPIACRNLSGRTC